MQSHMRHATEAATRGDWRLWHYWHMKSVAGAEASSCYRQAAKQMEWYNRTGRTPSPVNPEARAQVRLYKGQHRSKRS